MPITIRQIDGLYEAHVTPPHGEPWTSPVLTACRLVAALLDRGCHQTDIGDAFHDGDPDWDKPRPLDRLRKLKRTRSSKQE
jgi:hypothetical protein